MKAIAAKRTKEKGSDWMKKISAAFMVFFGAFLLLSGCLEKTGAATAPQMQTEQQIAAVQGKQTATEQEEKEIETAEISFLDEIKAKLIPKVKPKYSDGVLHFGAQLNSLNKMIEYNNEIELANAEQERFEKIASKTFCEFCCGPVAIQKCGCNHSASYKGIIKYLLRNFPQFSDEEIIAEQEKWKASFFQEGTIYKYLGKQKALGKVSDKEIKEIEGVIGSC